MKNTTPIGVSEFLPNNAAWLAKNKQLLQDFFAKENFLTIKTPTIEFSESLEPGMGDHLKKQAIEFFDPQGKRLMLRPDNTTPIARTVASRMQEYSLPLRLSYIEPVFRKSDLEKHTDSEIFQAGCEIIGYSSIDAVCQIIKTAVESLKVCGINNIGIDIGHVDFVSKLSGVKKHALLEGDYVTFGEIPARGKKEVCAGNKDLEAVFDAMKRDELEDFVFINQGLVKGIYYYTGIIFEIYCKDLNKIVASGGQYDQLCSKFGYDQPAVGFAINLNEIIGESNE